MSFAALLLTFAVFRIEAGPAVPALAPATLPDVRKQFVALHEKQDAEGCRALWREHPEHALPAIDADLEGSLKLRETKPDVTPAEIERLHARALWGAHLAAEASGQPLVEDYASAFVGWDEAQRKTFRAGQAKVRDAQKALQAEDPQAALTAAMECLQLTGPLGDWWGSGMGCELIAAAQTALGNHEKALESMAFARTIYHGLGLAADEVHAISAMVASCRTLGRTARAKVACEQGLALATKLNDDECIKELTAARAELDTKK